MAEDPHRKGGWVRTIVRPGIETATLLDDIWEQNPYARDAVTRVVVALTDDYDDLMSAFDELYFTLDDAYAPLTLCDRVEAHIDFHSGGYEMYGDACPLVWDDKALATPAGNVAATEFILRRIADLRRSGHTREARALRDLLPSRDEWREWQAAM
jgi:hypothetical protein